MPTPGLGGVLREKAGGDREVSKRGRGGQGAAKGIRVPLLEGGPADQVREVQRLLRQLREHGKGTGLDLIAQAAHGVAQEPISRRLQLGE